MDYKLYDRRTFDRYLEKGIVKRADWDSYLKNLPDESDNAQWVQMDLEETELSHEPMESDEATSEGGA